MPDRYEPPSLELASFTCPHSGCGSYAYQERLLIYTRRERQESLVPHPRLTSRRCAACRRETLWWRFIDDDELTGHEEDDEIFTPIWPQGNIAPEPHIAMPETVLTLFTEAGDIGARSPRAAAALLRLALQELLMELVPGEKRIDLAIGRLVSDGLDRRVQQAMDSVRVIGNDAVHPGLMLVDEDPALLSTMFKLINIIVEKVIAEPQLIDDLFESLPEGPRDAIARRDRAARAPEAG